MIGEAIEFQWQPLNMCIILIVVRVPYGNLFDLILLNRLYPTGRADLQCHSMVWR